MGGKQTGQSKKPYETPLVTIHGTVIKITEVHWTSAMDGQSGQGSPS